MNIEHPRSEKALSISFVTPTFARDIERFAFLRHSMKLFKCDISHLAYVDTEDMPLFKERFGSDNGLQLIATKDVLPKKIEKQRLMWRSWKGKTIERVGWRLGLNSRLFTGWKLQQIVKIEAIANLQADVAVFLDSDIIFSSNITPSDFVDKDNQVRLLETPAVNYEDFAFEISRQILTGGNLLQRANAFNYIHQAPRFLKRTGLALKCHLEKKNKDWHSSFFHQNFPSEYSLLGYAARELEGYSGYIREMSDPASWCYNVKFKSDLQSCLDQCKDEAGKRKFLLIQSNLQLPIADFLPDTEKMLLALIELDQNR
jgi:hypothetical protein